MQLKTTSSLVLALALAIGSGAAFAQDASKSGKTLTPQQERMVQCNKDATGKTGDERKTFMSACLKGESVAAAPSAKATQQEKMKTCSADAKAKSLKGDARKSYMSTCLKGDGATAAAAPATAPAAAPATSTAKATQQDKMKTCSADAKAKSLKGDARKSYMSTCLKGDAAAAH
jgi:hypothetical protein